MSAAGSSEENFLCSICLQVFSEPVSTPCGHNFCKSCIAQFWDTNVHCKCPLCNRSFSIRPKLHVNTFISSMVSQFKLEAERRSKKVSTAGDVECDVCSEPKLKAVKSCLVCLSSFCERHLQSHLTVPGLKRHRLMEPVDDLEDKMCPKHQRPLELFCDTDQRCVCTMCVLQEHKNHEYVSVEEACERRRRALLQAPAKTKSMVEQRRQKVQEIQHHLDLSEMENRREVSTGVQAFTVLKQSVQRRLDHFLEQLQEKKRNNQRQAQELLQQLQQEMCELEKSSSGAQHLSRSTDPLHFLQHCPVLPPSGLKDWSNVSFKPQTCEGSAVLALAQLEKTFYEELQKVIKQLPKKDQLTRLQQFAVDITLDRHTAHRSLVLSKDLKQVHITQENQMRNPYCYQHETEFSVYGKQSFSSGRFYFEVQVKGKTDWDLGVAQESIKRNRNIIQSPRHGVWSIGCRNKHRCHANTDALRTLPLQSPLQKVGVFVDYGAGLVSFYDVDSADLIYSFTNCRFSEKLWPFFSLCLDPQTNLVPLIITAVEPDSNSRTDSAHMDLLHLLSGASSHSGNWTL